MATAIDPRVAAKEVRGRLAIGPTAPVKDLLEATEEGLGLPVSVLDLGESVAGAYVVRRDKPFILINGTDFKYRRRFTLAHELGHHELGHAAVVDPTENIGNTGAADPREREANLFAGEFLAPADAVVRLVEDMQNPPITVNVAAYVAHEFGISIPAAFVRLSQADLVSAEAGARIRAAIDRNDHYGAAEQLGITPFEDTLTRIVPDDLPRLPAVMQWNALSAYRDGLIDRARLAEILGRSEVEVEEHLASAGISSEQPEDESW